MTETPEQRRERWAAEDAAFDRRDQWWSRAATFLAGVAVGIVLGALMAVAL